MHKLNMLSERNRKKIFGASRAKRHNARNASSLFIEALVHLSLSVVSAKRNSASIAVEMLGFTIKQTSKKINYSGARFVMPSLIEKENCSS